MSEDDEESYYQKNYDDVAVENRSSAAGMEMHISDEVEAAPTGIIGRKTPSNFTPI